MHFIENYRFLPFLIISFSAVNTEVLENIIIEAGISCFLTECFKNLNQKF